MIIVLPGKVELYIAERIFIMDKSEKYYPYSQYLKERYGEKVYKLPVNLPVSCPDRINGNGCSFCAEKGTGFEAMDSAVSVTEQLLRTRDYIEKRYHAHKFIAYFQNFTNTFLPLSEFKSYMEMAAKENIVEIAVSTRPDCIRNEYLDVLDENLEQHWLPEEEEFMASLTEEQMKTPVLQTGTKYTNDFWNQFGQDLVAYCQGTIKDADEILKNMDKNRAEAAKTAKDPNWQ